MKNKTQWEFSMGLYPGILFGLRSYESETHIDYVLYVPFLDMCLTLYNN